MTATPQRITLALDARGLYGPEVDAALGVEEPTVDRWESGDETPTRTQVRRLALLTGFPEAFFYEPQRRTVRVRRGTVGFICGPMGCQPL